MADSEEIAAGVPAGGDEPAAAAAPAKEVIGRAGKLFTFGVRSTEYGVKFSRLGVLSWSREYFGFGSRLLREYFEFSME